ncbi:MAG: hypothetical protein HY744_32375 [Deltaproteobacteria bacterium]|nr:hypothetical protein [Deltaproteobacteria bacterium]
MKHATLMVGMLAACAVVACNKYGTYCQDAEDCVGGNDADIDACVVDSNEQEDVASAYGCSEEFDALWECAEPDAHCDKDKWIYSDKCESKYKSLTECEHDASGHK